MRSSPIVAKRLVRTVTLLVAWAATSITLNAAAPPAGEREQIEKLIGSYYLAVAAENVDEVVDLHHWANSFERDKVRALTQQAFSVADSSFERVRVVSVDLFPERNIGLARVTVDARVTSFDGSDAFDTHLETVIVVVRGSRGWRIGRVARAADFDLTAAASQYAGLSQELEATVPPASDVEAGTAQGHGKLPKLAAATAAADPGAPSQAAGVKPSASSASADSGFTFFALRRKANGACEVVAGAEGISPGDTVLGAFPEFDAALQAATAGCGGAENITPQEPRAEVEVGAVTTERLYEPDDTVTRGTWGTVTRIAEEDGFAGATDGGQPVGDGFFVHPGSGGPTEIVYRHDGSPVTLKGRATVIDCLAHCGRGGTVTFAVTGDGNELWNSGLVRHGGPGLTFSVDLEGVSEVRLISTDGGNGNGEDWAAWLDLEVDDSTSPPMAAAASSPKIGVSPILAVPIFSGDDSTTGLFMVDLKDGSAVFFPDVGADPRNLRARPVNHNIFTVLGRPLDRPAGPGEILAGEIRAPSGEGRGLFVVETSTGSAVFLEDVGDGPDRLVLRRINGHPAGAIASDDGNFALLMRRDGSGSTDGAYLYHATSGRCLYFAHVDDMSPGTGVEFTSPLPVMSA